MSPAMLWLDDVEGWVATRLTPGILHAPSIRGRASGPIAFTDYSTLSATFDSGGLAPGDPHVISGDLPTFPGLLSHAAVYLTNPGTYAGLGLGAAVFFTSANGALSDNHFANYFEAAGLPDPGGQLETAGAGVVGLFAPDPLGNQILLTFAGKGSPPVSRFTFRGYGMVSGDTFYTDIHNVHLFYGCGRVPSGVTPTDITALSGVTASKASGGNKDTFTLSGDASAYYKAGDLIWFRNGPDTSWPYVGLVLDVDATTATILSATGGNPAWSGRKIGRGGAAPWLGAPNDGEQQYRPPFFQHESALANHYGGGATGNPVDTRHRNYIWFGEGQRLRLTRLESNTVTPALHERDATHSNVSGLANQGPVRQCSDGVTTTAPGLDLIVQSATARFGQADIGLPISDSGGNIPAGTIITATFGPAIAFIDQAVTGAASGLTFTIGFGDVTASTTETTIARYYVRERGLLYGDSIRYEGAGLLTKNDTSDITFRWYPDDGAGSPTTIDVTITDAELADSATPYLYELHARIIGSDPATPASWGMMNVRIYDGTTGDIVIDRVGRDDLTEDFRYDSWLAETEVLVTAEWSASSADLIVDPTDSQFMET